MKRQLPSHITKYYEALWCIWDSRLVLGEVSDGIIHATIVSSSRWKQYDVSYDQLHHSIMSNDNSSYRKGELWYPALALLLFLDVLDYQSDYGEALAGIEWKSLNTINNNNFDLTQQQVETQLQSQWMNISSLHLYCDSLQHTLESLHLEMLGTTKKPPIGN